MPSSQKPAGDSSSAPDVIIPGSDAENPLDLGENVREQRAKLPTQGVRYEALKDTFIAELKSDKARLEVEVTRLRIQEIGHLREDVRWLEESRLWQTETITRLRTSYESTVTFNLTAFALIAIGGALVSFAAFIPLEPVTQRAVAIIGFLALVIGLFMQAVTSYYGWQSLTRVLPARADNTRPGANPQIKLG